MDSFEYFNDYYISQMAMDNDFSNFTNHTNSSRSSDDYISDAGLSSCASFILFLWYVG